MTIAAIANGGASLPLSGPRTSSVPTSVQNTVPGTSAAAASTSATGSAAGSSNAAAASGGKLSSEAQEVIDGEEKLRAALRVPGDRERLEEFVKAVKSLKVPALKGALRSRNLPLKGKKIELQGRLIAGQFGKQSVPDDMQRGIDAV